MQADLVLKQCRRYDAPPGSPPCDIVVHEGRIAAMDAPADVIAGAELDAAGRLLIPGLIDIHIHGAGGADTSDGSEEALRTMSSALARLGTTSFQATALMRPSAQNRHLEVTAGAVGTDLSGARLLGLYIEGPFVNPARRGGIPLDAIYPYTAGALREILDLTDGTLRMMTVAPEMAGGLEVIESLTGAGVIASFGHSEATYEETRMGIRAGIRHATHLFNAMAGLHHRAPGPIPALLEAEGLPVELIGDGVHVDERIARIAARLFGPDRRVLITDAMRTAGLPDGRYRYGDRDFESRDGTARYLDGTLIGTSLSLLQVVLRFQRFTGCSLREAVDAATRLPARVLGIDDRTGSLAVGKDADLVLLDEDNSVWATVIGGRVVYRK